jgi:hypothetical protein
MFTTLAQSAANGNLVQGVRFDPSKVTQEETSMGIDPSYAGFSGLEGAGFTDVIKRGDGYRFTRPLQGGAKDMYQTRTATLNPDGTLSWKGSWNTKQKESPMEQFRNAATLAAVGVGGLGAMGFGPAAGMFGAGGEALSGMDLAADAALGTGNNIATAGGALGGGGTIAGTSIPQFSQLPGYGNNVATLADASGASPFTGGVDQVGNYLASGASEGSTLGNALTGAGGASGAVGAGTTAGTLGQIGSAASGLSGFLGNNSNLLNIGGSLLNSFLGARASGRAVDAQLQAGRESNALLEKIYGQTRADNMPALQARNAGLAGYQNLLQNPGRVTQDPGYKFGFDQGQAAYDNSGAARGMRLSGAQAKALTKFGQDYGQTKFNESLNRYGNLAGLGQTGTSTIANAGTQLGSQGANNITGMGNAAASGYIGGANAISGGISNFLNQYNQNNLLRQLGLGG